MPAIHVADAIAPALILGYGIGRLGCQISGDGDWGIVNELFLILWFNRPKIKRAGVMFSLYLTLMSVARFTVEHIRVNPRYDFLGTQLSQAQLISMALFLIGVFGLYFFNKKDNRLIF